MLLRRLQDRVLRYEPHKSLGFDAVDDCIPAFNLRQIMANWYVNVAVQDGGFLAACDYEDDEEVVHTAYIGTFVERDAQGNIVERLAS